MKKVVVFLILIGIFFGAFLGIRSSVLNKKGEIEEEIVIEHPYKDDLILPIIEIDTLNPILTGNKQVLDILKLIYEPLFDFDSQERLTPALAENYMEKDDLTWIITLKKDVTWHSGKPFSADDVIFTIKSLISLPDAFYYSSVSNIESVTKLENDSISITLKSKDDLLPYKLIFPIIPEYYFRDSLKDNEKAKRPVGTGPYKYFDNTDDTIRLKYNSDWWKKVNHKLNTIYLKQYNTYGEAIKGFKSSEIDLITTSMSSWEKKFGVIGINSYRYENKEFDVIIPNCEKTILSDNSVRRAILYSINRENIIDEVFEKNASKQDIMIHSNSWLYDENQEISLNQDSSKQLLANSSWQFKNGTWNKTINGKNYSLKLNLMVNKDDELKKSVAVKIKENLDSIGIKISIVEVNKDTFLKNIESKNFDLALGTLDIENDFDIIKLLNSHNYSYYDKTPMQENINQLYLSNISIEKSFKDMQALYKNEMPYIGLYFKTNTLLTNKAVKGMITPTYWNPYHNIWTWTK